MKIDRLGVELDTSCSGLWMQPFGGLSNAVSNQKGVITFLFFWLSSVSVI
jgi:hypothetical protein